MYREVLVPVDNSDASNWAVERAIELCQRTKGRITGNHVYAARLHDVRFRQLETGLPAQFQTAEEIKRQRKVHDKLIEKGLQLISDSFLDQTEKRCKASGVPLTRQLLEGINYEEIVREANVGAGRLPSLIGFDPNIAHKYDGGDTVRSDVRLGADGRIVGEDEEQDEKLAGSSGRAYDLLVMGGHGIGRQPLSQLGGVTARVLRKIEKDVLVVRDDRPLDGGRWMVCVDGSSYAYKALRLALQMAKEYGVKLFVCSAFDVEYHHVVFGNIKDVLSVQASKVFKFEEQEELHNNIIDKGLLKLCQANLKRAQVMAEEYPEVELETQILVGKPFQCILQWIEEVNPSLLLIARHGGHRVEGTDLGSQAENLVRLAPTNVLLVGTQDVRPDEIPWIEEDGEKGLEWAPDAEVRILRVPPFALGIARKAVEEFTLDNYGPGANGTYTENGNGAEQRSASVPPISADGLPMVTGGRVGRGDQEAASHAHAADHGDRHRRRARARGGEGRRGDEADRGRGIRRGPCARRSDGERKVPVYGARDHACPHREGCGGLDHRGLRPSARRTLDRPSARPQHRRAVRARERLLADHHHGHGREQAGHDRGGRVRHGHHARDVPRTPDEADQGAGREGVDGLTPEMRRFIEEAKAQGVTRCPIRDVVEQADQCPVDFKTVTPEQAKAAVEQFMAKEAGQSEPATTEAGD